MFLIDWEFSGMNNPLWDVAAYIIEAELSPKEETLYHLCCVHYGRCCFDGRGR